MKAIGYKRPLAIENPESLEELELPAPIAGPRDLLVRVKAISVNPVDTKVRKGTAPPAGQAKVLGWDAVGRVEALGSAVTQFQVGDRVYYAGSLDRAGANSELHTVDERIVALAPQSLSDADAAALPLTSITAYELLFDRLGVQPGGGSGQALLIVGGAGGVGSILIQLARKLTKLQVIATASRAETRRWCLELGAHLVIDHSQPLAAELRAAGVPGVEFVASLTQTPSHFSQILEALKPQGHLAVIDDMAGVNTTAMMMKSITLHWELMFTRPLFQTADMGEQGKLLAHVAALVDAGEIRSTATTHLGALGVKSLREAHQLLESGKTLGKVVLDGLGR